MSLTPLLTAPAVIQLHAFAALAAFALGAVQLLAPKGTLPHRTLGYAWVILMAIVAGGSFWIHTINQWNGFSLIHLVSIYALLSLLLAVIAARRHKVSVQRKSMIGLFVGALIITGVLTLLPGRIMHVVVFGGKVEYQASK